MLKRIISGIVGIILFAAILFASYYVEIIFNITVAIISAIAVWELCSAVELKQFPVVVFGCLAFSVIAPIVGSKFFGPIGVIALFLLVVLLCANLLGGKHKFSPEKAGIAFLGSVAISVSFSSLVFLRDLGFDGKYGLHKPDGILFILIACAGGWIADTGAYFTGSFIGKHKLSPIISPKKTVEGLIGGVLFNIIIFVVIGVVYPLVVPGVKNINLLLMGTIGLVTAFAGTFGDLSASYVKRAYGVKDYGKIMPGHGGVLDRFDSVLMVAPLISIFVWVFQPLIGIIGR